MSLPATLQTSQSSMMTSSSAEMIPKRPNSDMTTLKISVQLKTSLSEATHLVPMTHLRTKKNLTKL